MRPYQGLIANTFTYTSLISYRDELDRHVPFLQHRLSNHIHYIVWDEITYPFPKFENVLVISFHTMPGMWLVIHAGIKVDPC